MERLISPDFAIFSQKQAKSFEPDASLIESSISIECRTENSDAVLKPACQLRFFKRQDRASSRGPTALLPVYLQCQVAAGFPLKFPL